MKHNMRKGFLLPSRETQYIVSVLRFFSPNPIAPSSPPNPLAFFCVNLLTCFLLPNPNFELGWCELETLSCKYRMFSVYVWIGELLINTLLGRWPLQFGASWTVKSGTTVGKRCSSWWGGRGFVVCGETLKVSDFFDLLFVLGYIFCFMMFLVGFSYSLTRTSNSPNFHQSFYLFTWYFPLPIYSFVYLVLSSIVGRGFMWVEVEKVREGKDCWSRVIKSFEESKSKMFDERLVLLLCVGGIWVD